MPNQNLLYYETFGNKNLPAIIFLHGFLGSGNDWYEIIDLLKSEFYCVTIDLPGHGRSANVDEENYNFENCARGIVSIANQLELEKFNLVGYSMGGRLAMYVAINHNDKINKLILESASPGLKTDEERRARQMSDNKLAEEIKKSALGDFISNWYDQPIFDSLKNYPEKFQDLLSKRQKNNPAGLAKSLLYMGTGAQPPLWEKLRNLTSSSLLIVGGLDSKFQKIADEMCNLNKMVKQKIVTDAGHNAHFESPDQYAKLVREFLK